MNGQKSKRAMTDKPGKEDVHEQRTPDQPREGVVEEKEAPPPRAPTQTQTDRERADWEGMGQPQSKPGS